MTRRQATAAGLLAQAEASGYKRGAHKEQDQVKDERRHNDVIKKNHQSTLNRYILWQLAYIERNHTERRLAILSEEEIHAQYLGCDIKLPDLITVKDFLCFYIRSVSRYIWVPGVTGTQMAELL